MLAYHRIVVDNDVGKVIGGIDDLRTQQIGAVIATSSDPVMIAPSLRRALRAGIFVGTIVPPPATLILNAPQYATGKALTDAAIVHIKAKLGGKANVVLLTQNSMQYLAPRFQAMRDGLDALPGATIVADLAPAPVTKASGYATMQKILIAHPRVDVVLGGDAVVLGALEALRAAGKDRPDQFLGGIDGEPEGVAEIKKGNSPFKASIALSSPVFGYAMGQFAGDWLDGKSIPQAMDILPIALTSENIAAYEADLADPGAVFAEPSRRDAYLRMYGNICYDTRTNISISHGRPNKHLKRLDAQCSRMSARDETDHEQRIIPVEAARSTEAPEGRRAGRPVCGQTEPSGNRSLFLTQSCNSTGLPQRRERDCVQVARPDIQADTSPPRWL